MTTSSKTNKEKEKELAKILGLHRYKGRWEDSESYDMTDILVELVEFFEKAKEAGRKEGIRKWRESFDFTKYLDDHEKEQEDLEEAEKELQSK